MAPRKKVEIALVVPENFPIDEVVRRVKERAYFVRFEIVDDSNVDYKNPRSATFIYRLIGNITAAHVSVIVIPSTWGKYAQPKKGRASFTRFVYRILYGGVIAKKQHVYVLQSTDGYWYGDKDQICGAATEIGIQAQTGSVKQFVDYLVDLASNIKA